MTKEERLQYISDTYKHILINYKVLETLQEISKRGLEPVLSELIEMGIDAEMKKRLLEEELREYKGGKAI